MRRCDVDDLDVSILDQLLIRAVRLGSGGSPDVFEKRLGAGT